jgi:beta-lactamase class A
MTLEDIIVEAGEDFEGRLGVSVKNLETGDAASLNGGELFPTASVFKVPVIVELYRQVDAGRMNLDEKIVLVESDLVPGSGVLKVLSEGLMLSIRDLIELMMVFSDNTATDLLTERVGLDNVNATLRDLGLEKTRVVADCRDILFDLIGLDDLPDGEKTLDLYNEKAGKSTGGASWSLGIEDNDVTTPDEMTRLLEMIVKGKAASRASCDAILETMRRCQTGGYRIPKYLPRGELTLARKTGSLPGIRNDCGVITFWESGETYILSCFTKEAKDVYAAEQAIADVSKQVYDYFAEK